MTSSRVLADQLSSSLTIQPLGVEDVRGARLSNANFSVNGYFTRSAGRTVFRAVVRDVSTNRNIRWMESEGEVLPALDSFAKAIDQRKRPFGTQSSKALQAWGESMAAADSGRKAEALERALSADANWGIPYIDLAQLYLAMGDQAKALEVAKRADDRLSQFTDLDRARVELLQSGLRNDPDQRRRALVALSRLITTDAATLRTLAETEQQARRFGAAVDLYRNALAIEPDNAVLLNQLGYAEAYNGNLQGAKDALERYRALEPKGVNPVDSLGEVHFMAGRFGDAAKYFLEAESMQPGPRSALQVLKAAQARYLEGDSAAADELYGRFEKLLISANEPLTSLSRAQWFYITGRKPQALAQGNAAANMPNPEAAAYARVQVAIWKLEEGDRAGGVELARAALAASKNSRIQRLAAVIQAAGTGDTAGLDPANAEIAAAYASIFAKDYAKAAVLLGALYAKSSPANDGELRAMYALALANSGKPDEARPLLTRYFMPMGAGEEAVFATQAFPRFLQLRSALGGSR